MRTMHLLCPSEGERVHFGAEAAELFSEGPTVVQNLDKTFSFKKCREAHQIDQRHVLTATMYVCVGGGGFGMTPWCDDLVCSWRRLLADRHSLPFPWTLSLHRRWCPSASHHPLTFLFLLALTFPLPSPFPSLGLSLCRPPCPSASPHSFPSLSLGRLCQRRGGGGRSTDSFSRVKGGEDWPELHSHSFSLAPFSSHKMTPTKGGTNGFDGQGRPATTHSRHAWRGTAHQGTTAVLIRRCRAGTDALGGGAGWWRLAVGDWWRLAVGGWWRLAVGGWWRLAVGGWWRLAVGDWWLMAVGSGWPLAVGRRWRLGRVGGWGRLAVGGPLGRSLRAVLNQKRKSRS